MKTRYMADDSDDDKDDKNNKGQKDTAYLAQFDNIVNEIIKQIHSTNPAELARLNSAISSLLASDLPPKILKSLEALQAAVTKAEERAEQKNLSDQGENIRKAAEEAKLQESIALLEKEAEKLEAEKLAEFHQEGMRLKKQHEEFEINIAKRIEETKEETKKHNELFDYLSDENLKGKDIDASKLRPFIKNEAQIEEDRKLYRHQKEVHKRYDGLCAYDAKLKVEKKKLEEVVKKEEQKPQEQQSSTLLETAKQKIKHKNEKREELKPVIAEAKEVMDVADEQIQALEQAGGYKSYKELADKYKHKDSAKYQMLTKFDSLIKNQENAIKNDEPVADNDLRNAFLSGGSLLQEDKLSKNIADIDQRNAFLNNTSILQENESSKNVKEQASVVQISPNDTTVISQNLEQDRLQKESKDIGDIANKKFLSIKGTLDKQKERDTNITYRNNTNNVKKDTKSHGR
ncbi:hypothetical protein [Candidatus Tisiphia endosymbiont of Mystacides longicornis]|uniref:hypothetical protein n=1 Tax=Candidatus Tisiphia endosymbiont of Mystacides longicornis TaxID=3139330 RepID=UPI003CCA757F